MTTSHFLIVLALVVSLVVTLFASIATAIGMIVRPEPIGPAQLAAASVLISFGLTIWIVSEWE